MQEILKLHSESPKSHVIEVITAVGVNTAHVKGAADDLAVGPQTVLDVIAPVSVANGIGVSGAASAGVTSLDLDHDLIDLIELRSCGVERLRSVVTSGDTLGLSIRTGRTSWAIRASVIASVVSAASVISAASVVSVASVVSAASVLSAASAVFAISISAAGLNTNRVEGVLCIVGPVDVTDFIGVMNVSLLNTKGVEGVVSDR